MHIASLQYGCGVIVGSGTCPLTRSFSSARVDERAARALPVAPARVVGKQLLALRSKPADDGQ